MYITFIMNIVLTKYETCPFEHCVIDNFIPNEQKENIYNKVQELTLDKATSRYSNFDQNGFKLVTHNKFGLSNINSFHPDLLDFFKYLTGDGFVSKLEMLTGINGLIRNDYTLLGGGVHIITNGGSLMMHTDFNSYDHTKYGKLDRRINLLLYMNKDWKDEYNGDLVLEHNENDIKVIKKIKPIFNRAVIFNTTSKSVHGHPVPLKVPDNVMRRSIAVYYYTKNTQGDVDFEGDAPHGTQWKGN